MTKEQQEQWCKDLAELHRVQAELDKLRWIPVGEKLPKKREYIIVVCIDDKLAGCCKSRPEIWCWTNTNNEAERLKTFFTHWKPLILPKQALKEGGE